MPVRGCRDTLATAVASVLAQTLVEWELLVVQDEDDDLTAWVESLGDARIRLLRAGAPGGRGAARQAGLDAARARFLAFLDADDWMLPERLEIQVRALVDEPDLRLVSSAIVVIDASGAPFGMRRLGAGSGTSRTAPDTLVDSPVMNAASMIRTEPARALGYDASFVRGEDSEFFVRYLRGHRWRQDTVGLYCYREFASFSAQGLRRGLSAERRRHELHAGRASGRWRARLAWLVKRAVYEAALLLAGSRWVVARRCRRLTDAELARVSAGWSAVTRARDALPPLAPASGSTGSELADQGRR